MDNPRVENVLFLLAPSLPSGTLMKDHNLSRDVVRKWYAEGFSENTRRDSGVDLPFPLEQKICPGQTLKLDLHVRAVCMRRKSTSVCRGRKLLVPWAYRIVPRSSISKTPLILHNSEGIIDVGYRGNLIVAVRNIGTEPYVIRPGEALFQLVSVGLTPPQTMVLGENDELVQKYFGKNATVRGSGGFGSTGRQGPSPPKNEALPLR
jgi:dUTP pyrophosphatase